MKNFLGSCLLALLVLGCANQSKIPSDSSAAPSSSPLPQTEGTNAETGTTQTPSNDSSAKKSESGAIPTGAIPIFGSPPPQLTPEQIRKAELARKDGLIALYSKDPAIYNPNLAFQKFREAAEFGDPISMDHLGGFYSAGIGGAEKDCAKAIEWFEKSSQWGYQVAMNNLAYSLLTCEKKSVRDPAKAEELMHYLFDSNGLFIAWLDTYATLLAAQKDFTKASNTMKVVIDLAEFVKANPERVDEMKKALKRFQQKKFIEAGYTEDTKNFSKKQKAKKPKQ